MTDHNNHDINNDMAHWMSKLTMDEPSGQFTRKVMDSIAMVEIEPAPRRYASYYWYFLLVLLCAGSSWFLISIPETSVMLHKTVSFISAHYHAVNNGVAGIFTSVKNLSISPLVILGFLAILSLLVIDDLFIKAKNTSPSKL